MRHLLFVRLAIAAAVLALTAIAAPSSAVAQNPCWGPDPPPYCGEEPSDPPLSDPPTVEVPLTVESDWNPCDPEAEMPDGLSQEEACRTAMAEGEIPPPLPQGAPCGTASFGIAGMRYPQRQAWLNMSVATYRHMFRVSWGWTLSSYRPPVHQVTRRNADWLWGTFWQRNWFEPVPGAGIYFAVSDLIVVWTVRGRCYGLPMAVATFIP